MRRTPRSPPAKAFWSITIYDRTGFLIANELERFGLRSRDALRHNEDGSLDIYLGPECPDPRGDSNWIPTVPGRIFGSMRIYMPKNEYLTGDWTPPLIAKISGN